jgi:outer membrane protein assembly factor BamD
MVNKTRIAALMLLPVILLPVAGCAGKKIKGDTAYVARDVNTLYSLAKERVDKGQYEEAAKLLDEVERQHPYSVWARRAQLMSAFSYYMAQKYPDAVSSAQRFLTIHPGNKDAPYANYLIAMSYYQRAGLWQPASYRFRTVIDKYQTTTHTPEALERLVETYLNLGLPQEAQRAAAVLGRNYPGSEWYMRSYNLIQRHVPQAAAAAQSS